MLLFKSRWEFIPEGKNVSLGCCYCFLLVLFFACELFLATFNSFFPFFFSFFNQTAGLVLQRLKAHARSVSVITSGGHTMFPVKITFAMTRKRLKMLVNFCLLKHFYLCNTNAGISSQGQSLTFC